MTTPGLPLPEIDYSALVPYPDGYMGVAVVSLIDLLGYLVEGKSFKEAVEDAAFDGTAHASAEYQGPELVELVDKVRRVNNGGEYWQEYASLTEPPKQHDCWEHAVPYVSDGPLGHGFECGVCGAFLQAG